MKKIILSIIIFCLYISNAFASKVGSEEELVAALKKGNGKVEVKGLNGQVLTVMSKDGKIWIKDQKNNYGEIVATDVTADNGVIHVIDTVVMPN